MSFDVQLNVKEIKRIVEIYKDIYPEHDLGGEKAHQQGLLKFSPKIEVIQCEDILLLSRAN